ncbi:3-hydroxyacyl-CoA dehydrogenase family protein [uncultured Chitinophaga sp.]|uniref:3-hydroxyacyl-CoA dehydrogenase family protein n=1 Tax=uncultured Chitinophaga sp. TaxID=339340 RepID=UPI0026015E84|nr:3-hydroxyacyl-CoA dehydrogenase family protein [uncultured Chitinophaga sp.]
MNILVIGDERRWEEWKQTAGEVGMEWKALLSEVRDWEHHQLVIDLTFDEHPRRAAVYRDFPHITVLGSMVKSSWRMLKAEAAGNVALNVIGCNLLPGFMGMKVKEITLAFSEQQQRLQQAMQQLGWTYEIVGDQAGMVTPRVVSMIINEAYYAAEQQVASRGDIDISMKLGTNYPYGPFEWCEKIGIQQVYEVLQAVYRETGQERYKICELLQAEYFQYMKSLAANREEIGTDT